MRYREFVTAMGQRWGIPRDEAQTLLSTLAETVGELLVSGEDVRLPGLATFRIGYLTPQRRAERLGNLGLGCGLPGRYKIRCHVSDGLEQRVSDRLLSAPPPNLPDLLESVGA